MEIVVLFRDAAEALWRRAVTALGTVTLTAIADRVLYTATARYRFLSAINPHPNGKAHWQQALLERLGSVPRAELLEGLRFTLIDLLGVVGRLTAEILTDELHAALREVVATSSPVAPAPAVTETDAPGTPADKARP